MTKINNKNKIIVILVTIAAMTGAYFITSAVINSRNSDFNKLESINLNSSSTDPSGDVKTDKESFGTTTVENNKTKYSDGRLSEVRTESYYADSIKTLDKNTDLKLFFFVMEYNDYEAVVSDKDGVFGQLPSNTMTQIKKNVAGQNFFIFADTIFQKKFNLLTPMTTITDRSVNTVSFDFVTNKGVYTALESKMNLEKGNSVWSELYKKAKEAKPKY